MSFRALAVFVATLAAGCFDERPLPGVYACGVNDVCPANYVCNAAKRCVLPDGGAGGGGGGGGPGGGSGTVDVGGNCTVASDCMTANCDTGVCELASGPPFWSPISEMHFGRQRPAVALMTDGTIIAAGGGYSDMMGGAINPVNVSVEQYLPSYFPPPTNATWRDISGSSTATAPMVFANQAAVAAVLGGTLYIAGGLGNEQKLQQFDNTTRTFAAVGTTTGQFIDQAGSAVIGNLVYVFGGFANASTVGGQAEIFDASRGSWQPTSAITPRRALAGALGSDGLIYALGGFSDPSNTNILSTVQIFSPTSKVWMPGPALPAERGDMAAATGPDGRLYVMGGITKAGTEMTVLALTPGRKHWATVSQLMMARSALGAVVGADGLLYAICGVDATGTPVNTSEVYGPLVVSSASSVSGSNFAANANVSIYDGAVASSAPIAGGTSDGSGVLAAVTLPSLSSGSHTLTVMDDRSRYPVTTTLTVP